MALVSRSLAGGDGGGSRHLIILRDLTYRVDAAGSAKLDVYMPARRDAAAGRSALSSGILVIHGGNWIGGSKTEYGPQLARLTQHGYVVFAADYQLARPAASLSCAGAYRRSA